MTACQLLVPGLLSPALLPLCDAATAFRLLAASRCLRSEVRRLRSLHVALPKEEPLCDDGARGLARTVDTLASLKSISISLGYQDLGPCTAGELAAAIMRSKNLTSVAIDLRHNGLGDEGALEWARAVECLPGLEVLDLRLGFNGLGQEAVVAVARALHAPGGLREVCLELDINHIGDAAADEVARAVAGLVRLERLRLDLACCGLGDAGACALAGALAGGLARRAPAPLAQVEVDLRGNDLEDDARRGLEEAAQSLRSRGCRCVCRA
mmetsp:Transcript_103386/g.333458  ORF Transcript_103386/g.333458 Transcript_103386/m.333458 type:complete len:268 (+) Transcript_103386:3-806(+)